MKVADLRWRLTEKLAEVASCGDEQTVAAVADYSRLMLVALASHEPDDEVDLKNLTLSVKTAALVLRMHVEYLIELIRRGTLKGEELSGEYRIPLSALVSSIRKGPPPTTGQPVHLFPDWTEMHIQAKP